VKQEKTGVKSQFKCLTGNAQLSEDENTDIITKSDNLQDSSLKIKKNFNKALQENGTETQDKKILNKDLPGTQNQKEENKMKIKSSEKKLNHKKNENKDGRQTDRNKQGNNN
jgi:hypothetical protein